MKSQNKIIHFNKLNKNTNTILKMSQNLTIWIVLKSNLISKYFIMNSIV